MKSVPGREAIKTQIVYESGINFHTVVPYLELITRNGLAERIEGGVPRYRTTAKGAKRSAFQGTEGAEHFAKRALDHKGL